MGFFSFVQEIAMDLGTANTIIISDDKIVVDEPSVVALDRRTDKMIAVGNEAKMMYEKTHENIRTIRPLRDGVIADFSACEQMMRGLIKMVHTGSRLFSPSLRMVIGVPSGSTEVELRAVRDSAEHADGRDVNLIFEPMAAAIGIGIDVEAPEEEEGSQWSEPSGTLQQTTTAVEGAGIFRLINSDDWILMYDCYMNGHYQFCSSPDLFQFTFRKNTTTQGAFTPRHGTVIPITEEEYQILLLLPDVTGIEAIQNSKLNNQGGTSLRKILSPSGVIITDGNKAYDLGGRPIVETK